MKIHVNSSLKDSKQLCKDIKSSKDETSMYSEKRKVNNLHSDGMDESPLSADEIEEKELNKIFAHLFFWRVSTEGLLPQYWIIFH